MATSIGQTAIRPKYQTTCVHHKGKQLDLYCKKCQESICPTCITSIHKKHPVCEISDITSQKKRDIKNFIDKTEQNDLLQVKKYITSADTLLKENTSNFEKLSHKLKTQTDKLKQDLDLLTGQTLSIYKKIQDDNTKLIQKYKEDLEMYEHDLQQQIQECKRALQVDSHLEIYNTECEIYSSIHLPVKPVLGTASFTSNSNPHQHLQFALGEVVTSSQTSTDREQSVFASGQSEVTRKKSVPKKKLRSKTKVLGKWVDLHGSGAVCPTTDRQVWTKSDTTIILLNRKGEEIQKVSNRTYINDISLSPTSHTLWVCDWDNNIMELVSGQLINKFTTKEHPMCICATASNHIIVGMYKQLSKFTTQGQMVLTLMAARTGKPMVCSPFRISECQVTHNVAVIDFNNESDGGGGNSIAVMDTDFQELFVYRGDIPSTYKQTPKTGSEPFNPFGVAYDSMGNLIIGDNDNCRVLLLSGGGEFLRIIYSDTDKIRAVGLDREDVLWLKLGLVMKLLQYSK
ncbi:uncharacterized protein LOC132546236 [Ylistrum balloti]|uniref:uncharacterized protein LOC132546236 n=1 Tax=Ylistrum balloti TaxID=509963 RepID=UPI0029058019|nr:uncharacterized protein LOC132546236 [Ylistrum balloti]